MIENWCEICLNPLQIDNFPLRSWMFIGYFVDFQTKENRPDSPGSDHYSNKNEVLNIYLFMYNTYDQISTHSYVSRMMANREDKKEVKSYAWTNTQLSLFRVKSYKSLNWFGWFQCESSRLYNLVTKTICLNPNPY